jgi:hypothetical protein
VNVDTGLFSFILRVVNPNYEMLTWKVYQGRGRVIFLLGRSVKAIENFIQISSDTGHLLVCYHITFCIFPFHKCLHIYNRYGYDCDRREWLLTFVVDVIELEKYHFFFFFFFDCFMFQS